MKRILALGACVIFLGSFLWVIGLVPGVAQESSQETTQEPSQSPSQSHEVYENLMEAGNQRTGALALHIQGKDGAAALEDSKLLHNVFGEIAVFFEKRNASDAVEFARNVQAGFKEAGELASEGKFPEAMAKFQATRSNCDNCHKAHRERTPEGDWKIK